MRDTTQLHPRLQEKLAKLKELCASENLILGIGECLRTVEEQDALYAQGRTAPGQIVTYARGASYSSQHQWGIAFDFFKNIPGHAYDDEWFFFRVGALAKRIGLAWGGDWTSPVDMPHIYLPDWGDTPAPLRKQYGTPDRFFATWKPSNIYDRLEVDGYWGMQTTRRLQQVFGTHVDGVVSSQYIGWKADNPGLVAGFEWVEKPTGSPLIRAIQAKVGADIDGILGPDTIMLMQRWMGTPVDGCIDSPSLFVKTLQKWLNGQK